MAKRTNREGRKRLARMAAKRRRLTTMAANQYSERLHSLILRQVRHPDDVKDIKQNTLLKFYRSVSDKYNDANIEAFLFQIAKCQIAEYWARKNKDNAHLESTEDLERGMGNVMSAISDSYSAEDPQEHEQNRQRVREAIAGMPQKMSACLMLYVEGKSTREIAQALGTTEAAVRQLVCRGRELLIKLLQE